MQIARTCPRSSKRCSASTPWMFGWNHLQSIIRFSQSKWTKGCFI